MKITKYLKENSLLKTILTVFALSVVMALFQTAFQHDKSIYKAIVYLWNPHIILLNILPIFLIILLLAYAIKRIDVAFMITSVPLFVILVINKYKIYFRDEPLLPLDFALVGETANIVQNYNLLSFRPVILLGIIAFVAICIWVIRRFKGFETSSLTRICVILSCVVIGVSSYFGIYSSKPVYDHIVADTGLYHDTEINTRLGFVYSFISKINSVTYTEPQGYSDEKANEIFARYETNEKLTEFPNVIAIMSEAFFDAQGAENVKFNKNLNPYEKYNKMKRESYYGNIVVPGFGGSTASTEFEFLTGNNISLIDNSMPVVYKTHINQKVYSLAAFFKEIGFKTTALHLHHKWFYNRQNVYPRMGFDEFIGVEDVDRKLEKVYNYVSDAETTSYIIDSYKNHLETNPEKGYFNFTVTIQNHGPYNPDYTESYRRLIRPDGLDDTSYNVVSNYFNGVYDAVELLDNVKNYLKSIDTPTVLVFFGDHLAYFDDEFITYQTLGYDFNANTLEGMYGKYAIPYIIWANDAARDFIKERGGRFKTGYGGNISSNYLAAQMFECVDVGMPPFFAFVNDVKDNLNCIKGNYYVSGREFSNVVPEEYSEQVNDYKILQYYNLKKYSKKDKRRR